MNCHACESPSHNHPIAGKTPRYVSSEGAAQMGGQSGTIALLQLARTMMETVECGDGWGQMAQSKVVCSRDTG